MNKGMFSLIIPTNRFFMVDNGENDIDNLIKSILDQNYTNYEILIVTNGEDREFLAEYLTEKYEDQANLFVYQNEEASAPAAKNIGLVHAKGEYHMFIGSDTLLYPGLLEKYATEFKANPEASLLYTDLEYLDNGVPSGRVTSFRQYDRHVLLASPYIDGTSAVRAIYSKPWDTRIKALQDWGWSINCTSEAPAVKVPGVWYGMEMPREGGLGTYFNEHWEELVALTKEIYNLPKREMVVTGENETEAIRISKLIEADFVPLFMLQQRKFEYKLCLMIGYNVHHLDVLNQAFKLLPKECAKVIFLSGLDLLSFESLTWRANKNLCKILPDWFSKVIVGSAEAAALLEEMGVQAGICEPVADLTSLPFKYTKIREIPTIGLYTEGWSTEQIEQANIVLAATIAGYLPEYKFNYYGTDIKVDIPSEDPAKPNLTDINMEVKGNYPVEQIADEIDIFINIPTFSTEDLLSTQMIVMGKEVVNANVSIHGAYNIGSGDYHPAFLHKVAKEIVKQVKHIVENHKTEEQAKADRDFFLAARSSKEVLNFYLKTAIDEEPAKMERIKAKIEKAKKGDSDDNGTEKEAE